MILRNLRASGSRLTADVHIGHADNGAAVTTAIVVERYKNEELAEALMPVENLLLRLAKERIGQASDAAAIQARIDEALPKAVAKEKERLARNADKEIGERVTRAEETTRRLERELESANERWREQRSRAQDLETQLVAERARQAAEQ